VLEVLHYDRATAESVVAAGWGRRTQWALNVAAGGAEWVSTAGAGYRPAWRVVGVDEGEAILEGYERRKRGDPVVRAVLSRPLGWRYDGSVASRRRAVDQLGMLAFQSAPE
jgi:hypothetical protein